MITDLRSHRHSAVAARSSAGTLARWCGAAVLAFVLAPQVLQAQTSGAAVRLLVPLAAGGPSDQAARLLAKPLAVALGQEVLVENKPGANGALGAQAVAMLPADGHSLLFAPSGLAGLPVLMKTPPFASLTEFTPLGAVGGNQFCLFVHPSLPVADVAGLVAHARANPDRLSYGVSTSAEYLVSAHLIKTSAMQMARIPYRGSAQMLPDLLEGRVQLAFMPAGTGAAHARSGKLKALACNVPQRLPGLAEVPTLLESGVPALGWHGYHFILAPKGMPAPLAQRLAAALGRASQDAEFRAGLERLLIPIETLSAEQTTSAIRAGERSWAQFVRDNGLVPE